MLSLPDLPADALVPRTSAIVGDKSWERHLAKVAQPFYAKEAKIFETDDAPGPGWKTDDLYPSVLGP